MNRHHSLADEKEALLAKMQASRVAYQRMLLGTDTEQDLIEDSSAVVTFPRSKTMRWLQDHPYLAVVGLAATVLATRPAPRRAARSMMVQGRAVSSVFSRNQNKIRVAIGIATALSRFLVQRRQR